MLSNAAATKGVFPAVTLHVNFIGTRVLGSAIFREFGCLRFSSVRSILSLALCSHNCCDSLELLSL